MALITACQNSFIVTTSRREEADEYGGERKSYIFDLDVREDLTDDETMEEKYSVDGYAHGTVTQLSRSLVLEANDHGRNAGNWTRFVKYVHVYQTTSLPNHAHIVSAILATPICAWSQSFGTRFLK